MRESKDILFISDNLPPVIGGSATVYEKICENLTHRCVVLSSTHFGDGAQKIGTSDYDATSKYEIFRIKMLRTLRRAGKSSFTLRLGDELTNKIAVSKEILKFCSKYKIKTIVLGELVTLGWVIFLARYVLRKKVIVYTHGEEITEETNSRRRRFIKAYLKHANHIVAVSNFCKLSIIKLHEIKPSHISVISNGVDTSFYSPAPDREGLRAKLGWDDKQIIFSAGRHVERKGFDYLVEAMPAVLKTYPSAQLWIAGKGPLTAELKSRTEELGLKDKIIFTGGVSKQELLDMYQACDLFAMPNRTLKNGDTEGFGLVFLEANACGRPALAGQGGGSIEAIFDGVNGQTVSANNPENISNALIALLENPESLEILGARGLAIAKRTDWTFKNKQFEKLVDGVASGLSLDNPTQYEAFGPNCVPAVDQSAKRSKPVSLVTVDVEEQFDWENIGSDFEIPDPYWLRIFHEQAVKRKVKPLYVVTYQILTSAPYVEMLKNWHERDECELGIHLHGWNTPPVLSENNSFYSFQCNVPPELENYRLSTLCDLFENVFGMRPLYHRAGRYGVGRLTFKFLQENGVKVDLSPSPPFDYAPIGGVNFKNFSNSPFWVGAQDDVLCIPCSGMRFLRGPDWVTGLSKPYLKERFGKAVRLSPEDNPLSRLQIIGEQLIKNGSDKLVLSIHSTSLVPRATPYAKTKEDALNLADRLFDFVDWAEVTHGVKKESVSAVHNHYLQSR